MKADLRRSIHNLIERTPTDRLQTNVLCSVPAYSVRQIASQPSPLRRTRLPSRPPRQTKALVRPPTLRPPLSRHIAATSRPLTTTLCPVYSPHAARQHFAPTAFQLKSLNLDEFPFHVLLRDCVKSYIFTIAHCTLWTIDLKRQGPDRVRKIQLIATI